jgi:NAD(P)-dependent dehydrogenase (short-subunit alcohol dehydrogenase family)
VKSRPTLGTLNGAALLAQQVRSIVGDGLDVLVSNAGISKAAPIADYTAEDYDNLFATNVQSPEPIPTMKRRPGGDVPGRREFDHS